MKNFRPWCSRSWDIEVIVNVIDLLLSVSYLYTTHFRLNRGVNSKKCEIKRHHNNIRFTTSFLILRLHTGTPYRFLMERTEIAREGPELLLFGTFDSEEV